MSAVTTRPKSKTKRAETKQRDSETYSYMTNSPFATFLSPLQKLWQRKQVDERKKKETRAPRFLADTTCDVFSNPHIFPSLPLSPTPESRLLYHLPTAKTAECRR